MRNFYQRSLLVVEDQRDLRDLILECLGTLEVETIGVSNGQEALDLLRIRSFDAILADIRMEPVSGFELLEELKARRISTPVVILTAFGEKEYILRALRLGVFDFLEKPFGIDSLMAVVTRAIESGCPNVATGT